MAHGRKPMHEDFYSVATTVALVFVLGGIALLQHATRTLRPIWTGLLNLVLAVPTVMIISACLGVLAEIYEDTAAVRRMILVLVYVQMSGGLVGLIAQGVLPTPSREPKLGGGEPPTT